MRKLTKIVAPALIAAMGMAAAAVPAQAQPYGHQDHARPGQHNSQRPGTPDHARPGQPNINHHVMGRPTPGSQSNIRSEINDLNRQINRAEERRTISKREANTLKRDVTQVQRLYTSYARNGLSRDETRTLQNRVDRIQSALKKHSRDNRR